jgi:hypothetical protein
VLAVRACIKERNVAASAITVQTIKLGRLAVKKA